MVEVEVVMIERRYVSIIIFDMKWAFVTTENATVYRKTASGQLKISVSNKNKRWERDTQIMLNQIQSCQEDKNPKKWYTERGMCQKRSFLLLLCSVRWGKGSSDGSHNSCLWWPINLGFISFGGICNNNCQICVCRASSENVLLINLQLGQCRWVIDWQTGRQEMVIVMISNRQKSITRKDHRRGARRGNEIKHFEIGCLKIEMSENLIWFPSFPPNKRSIDRPVVESNCTFPINGYWWQ